MVKIGNIQELIKKSPCKGGENPSNYFSNWTTVKYSLDPLRRITKKKKNSLPDTCWQVLAGQAEQTLNEFSGVAGRALLQHEPQELVAQCLAFHFPLSID